MWNARQKNLGIQTQMFPFFAINGKATTKQFFELTFLLFQDPTADAAIINVTGARSGFFWGLFFGDLCIFPVLNPGKIGITSECVSFC